MMLEYEVEGSSWRPWADRGSHRPRSRSQSAQPDDVNEGERLLRYITHEFAHDETLDRAYRWLIQSGFDPARIEAHHHGVPRLVVAVEAGEAAGVEMVIHAAESGDPDGMPSFWDLARHHHVYHESQKSAATSEPETRSASFVVGWRPVDSENEVAQASTDVDLQKAYRDRWGNGD